MIFLTADYHFWHNRIIEYCQRPFPTVEEMNETIVENHNSVVKPDDTVFFLGDFGFCNPWKFFDKLNGHFVFIKGNHDRKIPCLYLTIRYKGKSIYMVHNPHRVFFPNGYDYYFCGHVHNQWLYKITEQPFVNIGIDVWKFFPVPIDDAIKVYEEVFHDKKRKIA